MTKIENDLIKHQIELERVENGIVRDCIKQLNASCRKVSEELARTNGVTTKKRYQQIRSYLKETAKELESNVESTMDLEEFIDYELQTEKKMFDGLNLTYPTKEQLITSVQFAPYCKSAVFENYLDSIGEQFFSVWDGEVRSGYLTGMTAQQITRRVVGSVAQSGAVTDAGALHTLRNSILMNTRTALQGFANNTRMAIFEKNADAFKGYKWLSTLDRRTCLPATEKVLTPYGYKFINEIKVGDFVIGGSRKERKVLGFLEKDATEIIEIELENGKKIRCTPEHEILTERGWVMAGELNEKDTIRETM